MQNIDGPVLDKLFTQDLVNYLDKDFSLDISGHKSSITISRYRTVIHPDEVQGEFNKAMEIFSLVKRSPS